MKVICINNGPLRNNKGNKPSAPQLIEGNTYTVDRIEGVSEAYILKEVEEGEGFLGFNNKRFIPLSNIDETELVEQRLQTA